MFSFICCPFVCVVLLSFILLILMLFMFISLFSGKLIVLQRAIILGEKREKKNWSSSILAYVVLIQMV